MGPPSIPRSPIPVVLIGVANSSCKYLQSVLVMVMALLGFLLVPSLGTSDFFLLFLMTLIDVVAGFTVSLIGARRDIGYAGPPDY